MKYIPVHTNILVELIKEEGKIVSTEEDNIVKARVRDIGQGRMENGVLTPMLVRPDSVIYFDKSTAIKFTPLEDCYVLNQNDIVLIEED